MTDDEQLTLWVGATRYHLGRMTYAVQDFCELLCKQWASLPEPTRKIIHRDVEQEFAQDDDMRELGRTEDAPPLRLPLGMDCDRKQWEKVRKLWGQE